MPHICRNNNLQVMAKYIYEHSNWTDFSWRDNEVNALFGLVRHVQGKLMGQMIALGFTVKEEAQLTALTLDVVKSSEIEGQVFNFEQVRSSIARRLGITTAGLVTSSRQIDGIVEVLLDATQRYQMPLTEERLMGWQAALFPAGYSGPYKIEVGKYRSGDMQIVSGAMGKEKVHYHAVKPEFVKKEMDLFLDWLNHDHSLDNVFKAAIAHFWFIIIHPFEDGNGRIARAITDMLLARSENRKERFYSMSSQISIERKQYYEVLQKVQHSSGDITDWLVWFLNCLHHALLATESATQKVLQKAEFWRSHENTPMNQRQRLMLNKLFDGFDGKLQTSKWAKITKTSSDTALRDIKDLVDKGILLQSPKGGRSVSYELNGY